VVEGNQHDDALEGLVGEHVLQYLYAESDDGKDVLLKSSHDLWEEVKLRVPIDSRRWFPTNASAFGKELVRLKQALTYKGFDVDRGTVGRGNNKKRVIKVTRIDEVGTRGDTTGTREFEVPVPAENRIDKPESDRSEEVGTRGTGDSLSSSGIKKKKYGRNSKRRRKSRVPAVPTPEKTAGSGVDKPNPAGTGDSETGVPTVSPNGELLSPDGLIRTDEGVKEAIRKLKGDK
jgi:hypothetical protein